MAGIYPPIITSFVVPFLTITSQDATSYNEIQQSLSNTMYLTKNLEITGASIDQILQPIIFETYDVNGDLSNFNLNPAVDPYQFQSALEIDLTEQNIIFDGKTKMNLQLLANNSINLDFEVAQVSSSGLVDLPKNINNSLISNPMENSIFKDIEKFQKGVEDMFDYDFMNRTGFFKSINTNLSECYPKTFDDLFFDFREEL